MRTTRDVDSTRASRTAVGPARLHRKITLTEPTHEKVATKPTPGRGELDVPLGATLGSMIGMCGPAIGLLLASTLTGTIDTLWDETLILVLIGLAIGLVLLLVLGLERSHTRHTSDQPGGTPIFYGSLLAVIGVGMLLTSHWITPRMQAEPRLQKLADSLGSSPVPDHVSVILIAAGIAVLARPAYRLLLAKR